MCRVPTILHFIPHNHTRFMVVDLCSAFFSIPVHAETQPLFEFIFKGMQLTWTRLAQGFVDSPAVFSAAVKRVLNTVTNLPSTVCVLNYTDDILISAETRLTVCKRQLLSAMCLQVLDSRPRMKNYSGCNPKSITWATSFHQD